MFETVYIIITIVFLIFINIYLTYKEINDLLVRIDKGMCEIRAEYGKRYVVVTELIALIKDKGINLGGVSDVLKARDRAAKATEYEKVLELENNFVAMVGRLFKEIRKNPEFKKEPQYIELTKQMKDINEMVETMTQNINTIVEQYNKKMTKIPSKYVAAAFKYKIMSNFCIKEAIRL